MAAHHPQSVHRLRNHLVRRTPNRLELDGRRPLVLTDRDKEILVSAYIHGLLTSDLVELAFFPPGDYPRRSRSSQAYERVRQLWLWGFLDRIELPVARSLGGSRSYLYSLGARGVSVVAALLGEGSGPVHRRRLDRLDDVFVDHDLNVTRFWANLKALQPVSCITDVRWISERDLRKRRLRVIDPENANRWLPFLPDGYVEIVYANGTVQTLLVEVDMGTHTLARFRAKIRAFEAFRAQQLFDRQFGRDFFEVAVLTTNPRRLDYLRAETQRELYVERDKDYQFATFDALEPEEFSDAMWMTPAGYAQPLLYDAAWEDLSAEPPEQ
jgi:Replication-relaxation